MLTFGITFGIDNPIGTISFASVIVLLLAYFLKPKPFRKVIPSLIFFESQKSKSLFAFFGRFVKDWLMLLQLLILILMCTLLLFPHAFLNIGAREDEVILVIDASASMNAGTRFQDAIKAAKSQIGVDTSIILAKDSPNVVLEHGDFVSAGRMLSRIEPADTETNVWESMLMAGEIANNKDALVVVISDFATDKELKIAKEILKSRGLRVKFNNIAKEASNVGIIDYTLEGNDIKIYVKNFDNDPKNIKLGEKKTILPHSIEPFNLQINPGKNTIKLDAKDDFPIDNILYIVGQEKKAKRALIITNDQNSYTQKAITSLDMIIDYAKPPLVNRFDYDVIIIDSVDYSKILAGTYEKIEEAVRLGTDLIVTFDLEMNLPDQLLPVSIKDLSNSSSEIYGTETMNIDFGKTDLYFIAEADDAVVIAESVDNSPIIALGQLGEGKILYYGIDDSSSSFKLTLDYPVFWKRAFSMLADNPNSNRKVGDVIVAPNIKGPMGTEYEKYHVIDRTGFFDAGDIISGNLVSARESDVNNLLVIEYDDEKKDASTDTKHSLIIFIIILVMLLVIIEILYVLRRGDL